MACNICMEDAPGTVVTKMECGHNFCNNFAHSPYSCLMPELWTRKCHDESETVNWITVHTIPCPKCHKRMEKDSSCNLVSCICRQAFWKKSGILLFMAM
ncbi:probable E3 ubiquitin-protein ligase ARI2 isoform X2 [Rhododendron vialii]|nr:probable E3 ubiquitin-protein ligase ARI2 isoform X2 [Rhododendron vialii]